MIDDADRNNAIARSAMAKAMWRIVPFSYGLVGGLFFLGYGLSEVPSGLMALRYGARKWLARITPSPLFRATRGYRTTSPK